MPSRTLTKSPFRESALRMVRRTLVEGDRVDAVLAVRRHRVGDGYQLGEGNALLGPFLLAAVDDDLDVDLGRARFELLDAVTGEPHVVFVLDDLVRLIFALEQKFDRVVIPCRQDA